MNSIRWLIAGTAAVALAGCANDGGNPFAGWFGIPKENQQQTASAPRTTGDGGAAASTARSQSAQSYATPTGASPQLVRRVQEQLKAKGMNVGPTDGVWGEQTSQALMQFQQQQNLRATGQIDAPTLAALGISEEQASADGGQGTTGRSGGEQELGTATTPGETPPARSGNGGDR